MPKPKDQLPDSYEDGTLFAGSLSADTEPVVPSQVGSNDTAVPMQNPAHTTGEDLERIDRYSDQMSAPQSAERQGIVYIPSSPPDAARMPEKAHKPYGDRRHLSVAGKATADKLPSHEDLLSRQDKGGLLDENEKASIRPYAEEAMEQLFGSNEEDTEHPQAVE